MIPFLVVVENLKYAFTFGTLKKLKLDRPTIDM
jgi:hypothetical protein